MKRNRIKLNETQLHNVIKESVRRVLGEAFNPKHRQNSNPTSFNSLQDENEKRLMDSLIKLRSLAWDISNQCERGSSSVWGWNLSNEAHTMAKDIEVMIERMFKELDPEQAEEFEKWHNPGVRLSTDVD